MSQDNLQCKILQIHEKGGYLLLLVYIIMTILFLPRVVALFCQSWRKEGLTRFVEFGNFFGVIFAQVTSVTYVEFVFLVTVYPFLSVTCFSLFSVLA